MTSPLCGDLSRLPPLLVQASEAEMLRDDSRRLVNRAQAAGSPARLQRWDHMVHVWQIFNPELPEARRRWRRSASSWRRGAAHAGLKRMRANPT